MDLIRCIQKAYPSAILDEDFTVRDDGAGAYIKTWNTSKLGPKPIVSYLEGFQIEVEREDRIQYILEKFEEAFTLGYLCSCGIKMDCGRIDLENMERLHKYLLSTGQTETMIRSFDDSFHYATIQMIDQIVMELIGYGLWLYQWKWVKEEEVLRATSIEEILAVEW